jgi:hypothetical protein
MGETDQGVLERHWKLLLLLLWLVICAALIAIRWKAIHWFSLSDTDDNMRMMQVRDMLRGQDWFDLRQYRMNPPVGANIHWSHLVDLPIAGLILLAKPFVGGAIAEKFAIAVAPLLPLGVVLAALSVIARRLIAPGVWILGALIFFCHVTAMTYFMPTRIDHHGWQLAAIGWVVAGLVDPMRMRGGVVAGTATALSFVIGMEMLPWLAIAGAAIGLQWIMNANYGPRMRGYALALSGTVALGYAAFTSYDNAVPRCDALTPVWLTTLIVASVCYFLLSLFPVPKRSTRILLIGLAGLIVAGFYALVWPACVGPLEQVSPEMQKLWLSHISESKPLYTHSWLTIMSVSVCLIGMGGNIWSLWRVRNESLAAAWLPITLLSLAAALMLLLLTRVAATALLFSVPGAVALGWHYLPRMRAHTSMLVRTFGFVGMFLLVSGLWVQLAAGLLPNEKMTPVKKVAAKASGSCQTLPVLHALAILPKATILTFVDMGPRIITVTHHDVLAGPYHRNGDAVLDVHKAMRGSANDALDVMKRHGATLFLLCPGSSESTIYKAENPKGFYAQMMSGKIPAWLEPVPLPKGSPLLLWRLRA